MQKKQIKTQKPAEKRHAPLSEPRKTFQQDGHWIEKPHKTTILVCTCGNRYLKTRRNQQTCLRCLSLALQ
jgi:hypothetical protein